MMKRLLELQLILFISIASIYGQSKTDNFEGSWKGNLTNQNFTFQIQLVKRLDNKVTLNLFHDNNIIISKHAEFSSEEFIQIPLSDFQILKLNFDQKGDIETAFMQSGLLQYHVALSKKRNTYSGEWKPWFVGTINPGTTYLNIEDSDNGIMAFPFFDDLRFPGTFAANFQLNNNTLSFVDFMTGIGFLAEMKDDSIHLKLKVAGTTFSESLLERFEGNFPIGHKYNPIILKDKLNVVDNLQQMNAELGQIDALIVSQKGRLKTEAYFNGFHPDVPHQLRSAQKSFTSALVGIAIEQGKLPNVESKLYDYLDEKYQSTITDEKSQIKLQDLLTMSSGLDAVDFGSNKPSSAAEDNYQRTRDWTETILNAEMINAPGAVSNYGSANPHLVGVILDSVVKEELVFYNHHHLMKPIGISNYVVQNDISNSMYFAGGMYLTPKDMLKFGELYLNTGTLKNKKVLNQTWIDESFKTYNKLENDPEKSEYGYYWWKKVYNINGKQIQSIEARGAGGQYIMVVPELELVVAITSSNFRNGKFKSPETILEKIILPKLL